MITSIPVQFSVRIMFFVMIQNFSSSVDCVIVISQKLRTIELHSGHFVPDFFANLANAVVAGTSFLILEAILWVLAETRLLIQN